MNSRPTESAGSNRIDRRTGWTIAALLVGFALIIMAPRPDGMKPEAQRLAAVTFLMAGLWVTQAVSLAATSLLPLALFPLLAIQPAKDVSKAFVSDKVFLYLGGFIIALSIERWNLHRRIALTIVNRIGAKPRQLVLGFIIATAGLSMWISNTASTLLMLPIALALLKTLEDEQSGTTDAGSLTKALTLPLLLGIAYSASIGGMTTIVGTPTNAQAVELYEKYRSAERDRMDQDAVPDVRPNPATDSTASSLASNAPAEISVAQWMVACVPIGTLYVIAVYVVLTWKLPRQTSHDQAMKQQLSSRLRALGSMSTAERRVLIVFVTTAVLWILRTPLKLGTVTVLPGWSGLAEPFFDLLGYTPAAGQSPSGFINDSTVAILMAVLLFFLPSGNRDADGRAIPLMNWETAGRLPWDIVLLFGGGFALAGAFRNDVTGLAGWLGDALQAPLSGQSPVVVIAVVCLLMTFLTEFTSNVATISTILPSLLVLCGPLQIDPRLLMVPATLATSCAFMLPIATPPNAIVFGSGRIQVRDMVRYGVFLNLLGVPLLTAAAYFIIRPLLGIP